MAITKVSRSVSSAPTTGQTDGTTALTASQSHTAGNLLVAVIQHQFLTVSSVVNTAGDTWAKTTSSPFRNTQGDNLQSIWYVLSTAGNANDIVTATFTTLSHGAGTSYNTIACYEFNTSSGTWAFDADSTGSSTTGTAIATGTVTVSGSDVIACVFETDGGNTPTSGSYTLSNEDAGAGFVWDGYHITSSSEAASATGAGSGKWGIIAASFKQAGSGSSFNPGWAYGATKIIGGAFQ